VTAAGRARIGVFGAGYVGLVTAAGLAELGRTIVLYDTDAAKIALLRAGGQPIHEAGLPELVARGVAAGRLEFTADPSAAVAGCGAVFIVVSTPNVRDAATTIAAHLDGPAIIVTKSTVPVDTGNLVAAIVRDARLTRRAVVVSNPEFLREGTAVNDFFHPDRIVIGCGDPEAEAFLRELYAPLGAPLIVTDMRTAEMIKYAAEVTIHDPLAMEIARATLGTRVTYAPAGDWQATADAADALVLATAWDAYREPDLARLRAVMRRPLLVDARNFYAPQVITRAGIRYEGIGRSA
jgi:UDP-glucose 6-dehydrogenase